MNTNEKGHITVKTTPGLLGAGVGVCALLEAICIATIIFAQKNKTFVALNTAESRTVVQVVFAVIALLTLLAMALCLPRWTGTIVLTPDNIIFRRAFSRKEIYHYTEYTYIYLASSGGGLCDSIQDADYLVLSKIPVAREQLKKCNQLSCSLTTIKVRISNKNKKVVSLLLNTRLRRRKR